MPWIFYAISTLIPTTYFIELMRAIILRGATLAEFSHHIAILAIMGSTMFTLAALRFQRKIT
jgi:ABC-2 type transport system permease protein